MNRVVHFEVHATDPARCADFYRKVFGWTINEWVVPGVTIPDENRYWLVGTGPKSEVGIDGGMVIRRGAPPAKGQAVNSYVCTIGVDSLDASTTTAVSAGATVALPKMPIKGVGWLAYFHDTEGNLFGMMQNDPTAG